MVVNIGTKDEPLYVLNGDMLVRAYRSTLENENGSMKPFSHKDYHQFCIDQWCIWKDWTPHPSKLSV